MSRTGNRCHSIVVYTGGLVAACGVVALMLASGPTSYAMTASSPSPTMASDMPGMDHGSGAMPGMDMPTSSPSPTTAGDSPWKTHDDSGAGTHNHSHAPTSAPSPTTGDSPWSTHDDSGTAPHDHGSGGMPGMDHGTMAGTTKDRPLAPVLGAFGGASSAVMLSAVFLRRKDRARSEAMQAARAARRTQK